VPPYAQPLLRQHPDDNLDLADRMALPIMIVHGARDAAVSQSAVDALLKRLPRGRTSRYDEAGHAPFVEDAPRFNRELAEFVEDARSQP
jgi:pimeloyl-ACP methyl ester carboxylesterase